MSIEVGKTVVGKVSGIANFGAFIDLEDKKTGLVHISEVSDRFIKDINEVLDVGQEVPVKVLAIADDGKISLSIRKAAGQEKKTEVKKAPASYPKKNRQKENKSFDALMNSFLRDSEDRLASLRRNTEGKRGGRGGRRG